MRLPRRQFLYGFGGAAAIAALPRAAAALDYPTRPVHIVVAFPPGGVADVAARLVGQWLSNRFGQSFVIENKPGASGNIAADFVAHAPPDGYTLLMTGSNYAINATLFDKLGFDPLRDMSPVAGVLRTWGVMVINPSGPALTVPDFIAYGKANPGKISVATAGKGSTLHMYGALFMLMTGTNLVDVPYRGATPALVDLIAGRVQVMFDNVPTSLTHIRSGELRALAVTAPARLEVLPEVPPLSDFIPGYDASSWGGIIAPGKTSAATVGKLNAAVNAGLVDPSIKRRFAELALVPMPMQPDEFGKLIAEDMEKWGKVIRTAHIKPD
jgi:tripartite-type tricarboxylate transporter receptor subunit TctC